MASASSSVLKVVATLPGVVRLPPVSSCAPAHRSRAACPLRGRSRRPHFRGRHQNREVPRDELADHAQWLLQVVGVGVVGHLRNRAFFHAHRARERAEMIDDQRNVGRAGFADRRAVVDRLGHREHCDIGVHAIGDLVEHIGARGRGGSVPRRTGAGFAGNRGYRDRVAADDTGAMCCGLGVAEWNRGDGGQWGRVFRGGTLAADGWRRGWRRACRICWSC